MWQSRTKYYCVNLGHSWCDAKKTAMWMFSCTWKYCAIRSMVCTRNQIHLTQLNVGNHLNMCHGNNQFQPIHFQYQLLLCTCIFMFLLFGVNVFRAPGVMTNCTATSDGMSTDGRTDTRYLVYCATVKGFSFKLEIWSKAGCEKCWFSKGP